MTDNEGRSMKDITAEVLDSLVQGSRLQDTARELKVNGKDLEWIQTALQLMQKGFEGAHDDDLAQYLGYENICILIRVADSTVHSTIFTVLQRIASGSRDGLLHLMEMGAEELEHAGHHLMIAIGYGLAKAEEEKHAGERS